MALSGASEQIWRQGSTGVCNGVILRSALEDSMDLKDLDSVETISSNSDSSSRRLKNMRDPSSHRMIEKRRRDRMNNCLASLSKLIPQTYLNKSRGRVEKTEIIEMAIKYIKHVRSISKASNTVTSATPTTKDKLDDISGLSSSGKSVRSPGFDEGYSLCKANVQKFLAAHDGATVNNGFTAALLAELDNQKSGTRPMHTSQTSPAQKVQDQPLNMSLKGNYDSRPSPTASPEKSTTSSSSIYPSSPGSFQSNVSATPPRSITPPFHVHKVPVFALHSSGLFYIADYVHRSALTVDIHDENLDRQRSECHPVSIPVRFNHNVAGSQSFQLPTHQSPPPIVGQMSEKPKDLSLHHHRNSAFDVHVKESLQKADYAAIPTLPAPPQFSIDTTRVEPCTENHRLIIQGAQKCEIEQFAPRVNRRDWTQALAHFDPGQRIAAHFEVK